MKVFSATMRVILLFTFTFLACNPDPTPTTTSRPHAEETTPSKNHPAIVRASVRPIVIDMRTPEQLAQAACLGSNGTWYCRSPKPASTFSGSNTTVLASSSQSVGPIIPTSWTVPQWYVDPSNVSGTASDNNNCTTTSTPCLTWHEINDHRWGCLGSPEECPRLRQSTNITFLSSHTTNADPVVFQPQIELTSSVVLQGAAPTLVSTVTLSGTTSKNRTAGSNSLLITNLGATGAVNQLVENTTHPSRAWVYKSLGANSFDMTQPLVKTNGVPAFFPAEVDTWANGDSVNLLSPVAINVVKLSATFAEEQFPGSLVFFQAVAFDANGVGLGQLYLTGTMVQEVRSMRSFNWNGTGTYAEENVVASGGRDCSLGNPQINGGASPVGLTVNGAESTFTTFDADHIISVNFTTDVGARIGFLYLDNATFAIKSGLLDFSTIGYGGHAIYGSSGGTVDVQGSAHMVNRTGSFVSEFTAPALISPGVLINSAATGCSHTNASPDVANCGITTTPAHLDATAGATGFGGNAYNPGGASVANF